MVHIVTTFYGVGEGSLVTCSRPGARAHRMTHGSQVACAMVHARTRTPNGAEPSDDIRSRSRDGRCPRPDPRRTTDARDAGRASRYMIRFLKSESLAHRHTQFLSIYSFRLSSGRSAGYSSYLNRAALVGKSGTSSIECAGRHSRRSQSNKYCQATSMMATGPAMGPSDLSF